MPRDFAGDFAGDLVRDFAGDLDGDFEGERWLFTGDFDLGVFFMGDSFFAGDLEADFFIGFLTVDFSFLAVVSFLGEGERAA